MQREAYHQILQFINHGIVATDKNGLITFINKRARTILGFGKKRIVGTLIWKQMSNTGKLVADCLETGKPQSGSHIFGKRVNLVVNINPIKEGRKVRGAVCNFLTMEEFEITAKSLKSIDSLDRQFKTVFESSSDGIWICDTEGKVISINGASERLGGIKRQDIIGQNVSDMVKSGMYSNYVTDEVIQTKRPVSQLQYIKNTNKTINIPPLRERLDDIFELSHHFLQDYNKRYKQKKKISPLTLSLMQAYPFRGNVRELKNLIKRAIIMSEGARIDSFILSSIGNDVLEEWNQATPKEKEINKRIKQ